jgi:hypothetical protein
MKSRPDIVICQGESLGGHENARESREGQILGEKMGSRNARNIKQLRTCVQHMGSIRGRSEVDLGSYGIVLEVRRCGFLMGYKNFKVPGAVDSGTSRNIAKVIMS